MILIHNTVVYRKEPCVYSILNEFHKDLKPMWKSVFLNRLIQLADIKCTPIYYTIIKTLLNNFSPYSKLYHSDPNDNKLLP